MKIVLIGFMGSGKSSVAKELCKSINFELLEVDELIVEKSNFESVVEIFKEKGEDFFRDLETKVLESVNKRDNVIISCGGGVIVRDINLKILKAKNSTIVFLDTSFESVRERIENLGGRPLFKDLINAKELYKSRLQKYEKFSDIKINTDNKSISKVAKEIIKKLSL